VTHSFLSLHNLSKEIDSIGGREEGKGSLFITAESGDYSRLLHSFHKKSKQTGSVCDLNGSKQGLLPRIKQNVNKEMMKELE
jgi:5'-3' exonuclease